jgi:uncharacterized OB-fold protein
MDSTEIPLPHINSLTAPYWESLKKGVLSYQCCAHCKHAFLPPRSECPNCLQDNLSWKAASGKAKLISWVVFHIAYHKAFESRLPYNVAVVELEEGPRLLSNVIHIQDAETLQIDQPLRLVIQQEGEFKVPRFEPFDPH